MPSIIPYRIKELHGSAAERDALLADLKARGILEAQDLDALLDEIAHALDDAETREREAFDKAREAESAGMSDAERSVVEAAITETFDDLILQFPAMSGALTDACAGLIHKVR